MMRRTVRRLLFNVSGESPDPRAKPGMMNWPLEVHNSPYKEQFKEYWSAPVPFATREYGRKPRLGDPVPARAAASTLVVARNKYADPAAVAEGADNDYKVLFMFRESKGQFLRDQFVLPSFPVHLADRDQEWISLLRRRGCYKYVNAAASAAAVHTLQHQEEQHLNNSNSNNSFYGGDGAAINSHLRLDPSLALAERITAMRALLTLCNLLIVPPNGGNIAEVEGPPGGKRWHLMIHQGPHLMRHLIDVLELPMEEVLSQLIPFRRVVTPDTETFRFDNKSFLVTLDKIPEVQFTLSTVGERLVWVSPMEAMARFNAGIFNMPTPNLIMMSELANECPTFDDVMAKKKRYQEFENAKYNLSSSPSSSTSSKKALSGEGAGTAGDAETVKMQNNNNNNNNSNNSTSEPGEELVGATTRHGERVMVSMPSSKSSQQQQHNNNSNNSNNKGASQTKKNNMPEVVEDLDDVKVIRPVLYHHGQERVATVLLPGDLQHEDTIPEDRALNFVRRLSYTKDWPYGVRAVFDERPAEVEELTQTLEREAPALLTEANMQDSVYAEVELPVRDRHAIRNSLYYNGETEDNSPESNRRFDNNSNNNVEDGSSSGGGGASDEASQLGLMMARRLRKEQEQRPPLPTEGSTAYPVPRMHLQEGAENAEGVIPPRTAYTRGGLATGGRGERYRPSDSRNNNNNNNNNNKSGGTHSSTTTTTTISSNTARIADYEAEYEEMESDVAAVRALNTGAIGTEGLARLRSIHMHDSGVGSAGGADADRSNNNNSNNNKDNKDNKGNGRQGDDK